MTKEQKLDKLDGLLLDEMISIMEKGKKNPVEYSKLSDLSTVSNYLAKNNRVAERKKSTLDEDVQERVKKAEERRKKGEV